MSLENFIRSIKQKEVNKIYTLVYQQLAEQDLETYTKSIFEYTGHTESALKFLSEIETAVLQLKDFPYSCAVYISAKPLTREYRVKSCGKYSIFYVVSEERKEVLIARILASRMDANSI